MTAASFATWQKWVVSQLWRLAGMISNAIEARPWPTPHSPTPDLERPHLVLYHFGLAKKVLVWAYVQLLPLESYLE